MNRNALFLLTLLLTGLLAVTAFAQDEGEETGTPTTTGRGNGVCQFVDEDGDGFNDLAPDADGDGIPNGQDEDYVRPGDGTGNQYRKGQNADGMKQTFARKGYRHGADDGTGKGPGSGVCDGSGPGFGTGTCRLTDGDDEGTKSTSNRGCRGGRK